MAGPRLRIPLPVVLPGEETETSDDQGSTQTTQNGGGGGEVFFWVVVIAAILAGGAFLVYKFWWLPQQEGGGREVRFDASAAGGERRSSRGGQVKSSASIEMSSFGADSVNAGMSFAGPSADGTSIKIRLRGLDTTKHGEDLPKWLELKVLEQARKGGMPELPIERWEENMDIMDAQGKHYYSYDELGEMTPEMFPLQLVYHKPDEEEASEGDSRIVSSEASTAGHSLRMSFAIKAMSAAQKIKSKGVSWGGVEEKNVDELSKSLAKKKSISS
mmetsp:Transcript_60332/g.127772  ORF Transcript_60332/g.127772 Transcript_60332/m.127772 type:complete len:273 (+) Transcript_60332:284-1102(+)